MFQFYSTAQLTEACFPNVEVVLNLPVPNYHKLRGVRTLVFNIEA